MSQPDAKISKEEQSSVDSTTKTALEMYEKLKAPGNVLDFVATEFNKAHLLQLEAKDWKTLHTASSRLPKGLDLTDESMDGVLEKLADDIIATTPNLDDLIKLDLSLCANANAENVSTVTALKMARSKLIINGLKEPVHTTWVIPVYKESNRILNRYEHAAGEDFVRRKQRQMKWLANGNKDFTYDFLYVDDGCPVGSGKLVAAVAEEMKYDNVSVAFLQELIDKKEHIFHEHLKSAKTDSRKGGAVLCGFYEAAKTKKTDRKHVIGFTDSDLSTHLGQTGLLVGPIVNDGCVLAAGSRYTNGGVYCSAFAPTSGYNLETAPAGVKESEGMWVHLVNMWSRNWFRCKLLPPYAKTTCLDTQCGFKAISSDIVDEVVNKVTDYWSTVDIELCLFSALKGKTAFAPVVWSESMAESNFWQASTSVYQGYWEMNATMLKMQQKYGKLGLFDDAMLASCKPWNDLVEKQTLEQYEAMIKKIGAEHDREKAKLLSADYTPEQMGALAGM